MIGVARAAPEKTRRRRAAGHGQDHGRRQYAEEEDQGVVLQASGLEDAQAAACFAGDGADAVDNDAVDDVDVEQVQQLGRAVNKGMVEPQVNLVHVVLV